MKRRFDLDALLAKNRKRVRNITTADEEHTNAQQHKPTTTTPHTLELDLEQEHDADENRDQERPLSTAAASELATSLFIHKPALPDDASCVLAASDSNDRLVNRLAGRTPDDAVVEEMLAGHWVSSNYSPSNCCPPELMRWLWCLVCYAQSEVVVASAAATIRSLIATASAGWTPAPADFVAALQNLGADPIQLLRTPDVQERPPSTSVTSPVTQIGSARDEDDPGDDDACESDLRANVERMLSLAPCCAASWRVTCADEEQVRASRWLWRLVVEPHAFVSLAHLQDALAALLGDSPLDCSPGDANGVPPCLDSCGATLRSICQQLPDAALRPLCHWLPSNPAGRRMQASAALEGMRLLFERQERSEAADLPPAGGADDVLGELVGLLQRLDVLRWSEHTEALHSFLLLLDVVLSTTAGSQDDLSSIASEMGKVKLQLKQLRGALDYYALECESLASFTLSKTMLLRPARA